MSAFQVQNLSLDESVSQSYLKVINNLNYSLQWTWNGYETNANYAGNITTDYNGYKVINAISANGINAVSWINNLIILKLISSTLGFNIYIIGVGSNPNFYFVQNVNNIINNGNNIFTIAGGDLQTGSNFNVGDVCYISYFIH